MLVINWSGRLGNILLENVGASILSEKYNLKTSYLNLEIFECLGFNPHKEGEIENRNFITVADTPHDKEESGTNMDLLNLLTEDKIDFGIKYFGNFQNGDFLLEYQKKIRNLFNLQYDNDYQEDVYIHVRLDDMSQVNPGLNYYKKCLDKISYRRIFLSTDSPNHEIIQNLTNIYNINIIHDSPINTINFAKNFGKIILSKGTFSWWIGFLSKSKEIFYPSGFPDHPRIFVFDNWKSVEK